jgi:MHS family alpha-ketoglutarate permease-like MFS transporter
MGTTAIEGAPAAPLSPARRVKAILAGSAGNLIEWYDFYVYAFTSLYFSAAFFPKGDRLAQIMATSGIFAVGFFMRPIGGWFFGRYADRRGRQASMVLSVLMMGGGSLLIAVLPTYAQVGVLAPLLLLIGRLVQGFSTGGEYGAAATYLSEVAGKGRRGFWSSFQYVTLIGGQVLATLVVLLLQQMLPEAALSAYGWRIAFAIGAAAAVLVLIARRHMPETSTAADRTADAGSFKALRRHIPAFLIVMGLTAGGSLSFYTFTTYMQKYLVLTVGLTKQMATGGMMGVLVVYMLLQPAMGALADRIGRRNNLIIFGALSTLCTVPIMLALAKAPTAMAAFALVLAGLTINSVYTSISGVFKAELFPMGVRALAVGLAYGVANALFGGTAENVALAFKASGHESRFYWYVTAICAVSLATALLMRDTRKLNPLDEIKL